MGGATARHKQANRHLLELFEQLAPVAQDKLIAFAEFLVEGDSAGEPGPVLIARPVRETVTMAIRRLKRSYPMLDRRRLMGEAARLMAQHVIEGRPAAEVIDDLEAMFARHYEERHKSQDTRHKGQR